MCAKYQDFLDRLKEERIAKRWTQRQMGHKLRMTQSHYSKAELGTRRFTYYEMKCLCESGIDAYYIFTGRRCEPEYRELLAGYTYDELKCYLAVLCSIAGHLYRKGMLHLGRGICKKIEAIQYSLALCKDDKTVFYSLRRGAGFSQKEMADKLEVDVKKLRDMENGNVFPDSEIMWKMWKETGVPFSVILDDADSLRGEVSEMAALIEDGERRRMLAYLKAFSDVLR